MNDKTITIFNYHAASKTWHRTVIHGVSYRYGSERTVASSGAVVFTQLLTIIIPAEADTSGKTYIDAYTITDLQKDFQKSGTVCSLSDNTDVPLLKHYKVVCK